MIDALGKFYSVTLRRLSELGIDCKIAGTPSREIKKIDQDLVDLDKARLDAIDAVRKVDVAKVFEDGKKTAEDVGERVVVTVSQGYEQAKDGVDNAVKTVQTALEIFTAKDIIVYRIENEMSFFLMCIPGLTMPL